MKVRHIVAAAAFAAIALAIPSFSQDVVTTPAPVSTNAPIPHYVRYSGTLPDGGSKSLQIRFSLYENQTGGQPVWSEIQTVNPVDGKYAVLLGAGTENGLPQSVFSAAQARWLGITVGAGQEQPRTILLATPYSLESSDAQTLAGHPASDFVLAGSNSGSNPAPKSESTKKPNTATDISQIDVTTGLTITNSGTGPTVTMGIDATKIPFLTTANSFAGTQTVSSGNLAIPATTSKTNGVITSGGKAIFQSYSSVSGANNLFLGAGSGNFTNSGKNNTGVGNVSLSALTTAAGNMALGTDSLGKTTSGPFNTAIGAFAGYYNITGGYNTYIGNSAGPPSGSSALTNATAIGASSVVNESNAVVLGGTGAYAVNVGIGTTTPQYTLDVQGTGNFTGAVNYGASGIFKTFVEASETAGPGNAAVLGFGSNGSVGTFGKSDTGYGVQGYASTGSTTAIPVFGEFVNLSNEYATIVSNYVDEGNAFSIWGDGGSSASGVTYVNGLVGTSDTANGVIGATAAVYAPLFGESDFDTSSGSGYLFGVYSSSTRDQCYIDTSANLTCDGTITPTVKAADNTHIETFAMMSAENWVDDYGSGQLQNGVATVSLDPAFAKIVNTSTTYHVFLTPNGDSKGLYVTAKGPNSFEVREANGGTSSIAFDYRIVAKRFGSDNRRLTDVTESRKHLAVTATRNPNHPAVRHAIAPPARTHLKPGQTVPVVAQR